MKSADKIDFTMTDEEFKKLLDELPKILLELKEEDSKVNNSPVVF